MAATTALVGASVAGSVISSKAAKKGANAQSNAANAAAQLQSDQYYQTRRDTAPYRRAGTNALYALSTGLGLETPQENEREQILTNFWKTGRYDKDDRQLQKLKDRIGLNKFDRRFDFSTLTDDQIARFKEEADRSDLEQLRELDAQIAQSDGSADYSAMQSQLEATPGYQFQLNQGTQAVERANAARGLSNSGATMKDLTQYSQGLAGTTYQTYLNNLSSLAGMGAQTSLQTAQIGAQSAANQGNALQNAGAARASGYQGQADAINGGLNNLAGLYGLYKSGYGA